MNVFTFQSRTANATKPTPAVQFTPITERRTRDFGVGYGKSSGYVSTRRYASTPFQPLFRCA